MPLNLEPRTIMLNNFETLSVETVTEMEIYGIIACGQFLRISRC